VFAINETGEMGGGELNWFARTGEHGMVGYSSHRSQQPTPFRGRYGYGTITANRHGPNQPRATAMSVDILPAPAVRRAAARAIP